MHGTASTTSTHSKYYIHPFRAGNEYTHLPVEHADGSYLYLADGRKILDFMSQYICVNIGKSHPRIREAIAQAADRFSHITEPWETDYRSKAAKLIIDDLLGHEDWAGRIRFASSGSEAVEMALIMVKLFTSRPNIVTQEYSYHGWTQGAAGTTGFRGESGHVSTENGEVREVPGFPPPEYHLVPAPTHYPSEVTESENGRLDCVEETERIIRAIGPETVAAFLCDVSQGPGIHPPPEYIPQIREMTQRLGILRIDDEVLCGFRPHGEVVRLSKLRRSHAGHHVPRKGNGWSGCTCGRCCRPRGHRRVL